MKKKRWWIIPMFLVLVIIILLLLTRCGKEQGDKIDLGNSSMALGLSINSSTEKEESKTQESSDASDETLGVHSAWMVSPVESGVNNDSSADSTNTSSANNEESTTGTSSDIDAEESTAAPVVESNNSNTSSSTPANSSVPTNSSTPANSSVPTNSSTSTNNSTPATESSTPATSTPVTESSTQTNSSTPATESSSTATSTPATDSSTATQPQSCNHAWGSRLVTIHHDATYAEEPIYGTKQGIIEEAWDEVVGQTSYYLTSDNVVFRDSDYATLSDCEAALRAYCGANGVSYKIAYESIYEHHDAVYGNVPDYNNIIGYQKVEVYPAWDEQTYEYYCTKCGEKL